VIGRPAEQVFRHDVDAAPDGEQSPLRHLGDFGRDIAAGVADAEHEYAPAGEGLRCAVVMRMHHLAADRRGARHVRVPRIPVMTVGNEHGCVPPAGFSPAAALPDRDVPAARAGRRDCAALRRLSVFAGRFSLDEVESVCTSAEVSAAQVLDLLSGLVGKSLLTKEDSHGIACYRLHETMREFARLKLAAAGEEAAAELRRALPVDMPDIGATRPASDP